MTDAATRGAPVRIRRALLSVSDKTGLVEQAQKLAAKGVELVSTGGTSKLLKEAGLDVKDVADLTGFPEMMDGRVKTLHPAVHGGLLYLRDNPSHVKDAETHGIGAIDLVVVNLYPFARTAAASGTSFDALIGYMDHNSYNPTWLRPDAGLLVVFVSDEEEQSTIRPLRAPLLEVTIRVTPKEGNTTLDKHFFWHSAWVGLIAEDNVYCPTIGERWGTGVSLNVSHNKNCTTEPWEPEEVTFYFAVPKVTTDFQVMWLLSPVAKGSVPK